MVLMDQEPRHRK
jgi:hypothetical protein